MILVPRRAPAPRRTWGRLAIAALLAFVGHAVFVAILLFLSLIEIKGGARPPVTKRVSDKPVVLRGLSAAQWEQNRGKDAPRVKDERTPIAKRDEKKPEKKPEALPKGQIVDVAPGNDQVDPNAKFIAETNNAVKHETRAKEQSQHYRNAMPQRTSPRPTKGDGQDSVDVASLSGNGGRGLDDLPATDAPLKATLEIPDIKPRSEVAFRDNKLEGPGADVSNRDESDAMRGNSKRMRLTPAVPDSQEGSDGRAGSPGMLTLVPSSSVLDKIAGAAANDHLRDVDEGDGTYLSTREWKYASFFNRVKQSVSYHWNPQEQLRLRDPTLQIYGGRDRHTLLSVTLNDRGQVKDVYVEKSCGVDFLDLEAIQAFERAQPFPNPPPGLVSADATVRFQFGFFLEMTGRPGLKLFRGNY